MSRRHKHDHEEHADETWLIPYADLLTLLLALFIVLYAMSSVDAQKFQDMSKAFSIAFSTGSGVLDESGVITRANQMQEENKTRRNNEESKDSQQNVQNMEQLRQQEQQDLEKLKRQIDDYIKKSGLTTQLDTKLNQSELLITISDNALFRSGESELKPESKQLAIAISNILQQYPDYEIEVSGHTDNQPINTAQFRSNWDLSTMRAVRFMDVLLQNKQLEPARFVAQGYGENHPIASNDTEQGRSKNRRVEVSIIRKYVDPAAAQQIASGSAQP